ncbi:MAG: hypothetical protein WAO76_18770 [Georgfuchsia sp.]
MSLAYPFSANPKPRQGFGAVPSVLTSQPPPPMGGLGLLGRAMSPPQFTLLSGLASFGAAPAPATAPTWIYVTQRFQAFLGNLDLTPLQLADGVTKIRGVVSCLNTAYYGHNSDTANAFVIGSWAKGTRIRPPRDIDLYFLLPPAVYNRFQAYASNVNKQTALLQEVKSKLLGSNPLSRIKGDGPVVLADFASFSVEVVPAFALTEDRAYWVCDTKNGGSYKKTMPLHEVDEIEAADIRYDANVRRLIRMLKCWQAWCMVPIKSFNLELLAIEFVDQWAHKHQGYFYYDWMCRDFFGWIITKANTHLWAPGTFDMLWLGDGWKSQAESAYRRAVKACDFERANDMMNAGDEWQKIFGLDIPKWL